MICSTNYIHPGISTENNNSVSWVSDEPLSLGFIHDGNSMEQILWKVGVARTRVRELITRFNKVMSENAEQISSANKLSLNVACDALTGYAQNHASPPNNGDRMLVRSTSIASPLLPKHNIGDLVMPGNAVSGHGEVSYLPDNVESMAWFPTPRVQASYKNVSDFRQ